MATTTVALTASPAAAVVRTDDGGDVPFYARIASRGNQIFHDDKWAVIVFYRSTACIPRDFNLLSFFDFPGPTGPGAYGCTPATTEGFNLWQHGPGLDPAPFLAVTHGLGEVPVWFVNWPLLEPLLQDGVLTLGDIEAMPSELRLVGSASYFHHVIQPHDAAPVPMTLFVARGSLDDGRDFFTRGLFVEGQPTQTQIAIGGS